jgi:hypothetical protein
MLLATLSVLYHIKDTVMHHLMMAICSKTRRVHAYANIIEYTGMSLVGTTYHSPRLPGETDRQTDRIAPRAGMNNEIQSITGRGKWEMSQAAACAHSSLCHRQLAVAAAVYSKTMTKI